ncbi:MAG TPA: YetF domain-containing protein [Segetibacter sp.]|jgi:uncharacterized membrane protein YcaP (DUF421 family)
MKKEEIHFGDINRWLFGQTPPEFMIEVAIRTILVFVILLLLVRLMGKRMTGQITLVELAVMITLGAIVSPVMQLPDRGIIFGIIALTVALIFQRGINLLAFKNEKVEHITQGVMSLIIKDGQLVLEELEKARLTKHQVFAMLREKKIQNLGKVERAYLEACGILSVFEAEETKPGLPVLPISDPVVAIVQHEVADYMMACCNCGHVQHNMNEQSTCELCNAVEWTKAYLQTN